MKQTPALLLVAFVLVCFSGGAASAQKQDFSDIPNFLRIDKQICTGGQPTMDDLARMKSEGVKAIVNLRRPAEYDAATEEAKAHELGLRYLNIPVNGKDPKDEQADEFLKFLADEHNRPVFIHCASANRVGGFWMIRRVLVDGWKIQDAEQEAEKIGMRSPELRAFARDYIRRHAPNPSPAVPKN